MPEIFDSFRLTPQAEADLIEIWDYSAEKWSPEIAEAYYNELLESLEKLLAGLKPGQDVGVIKSGYFRIKAGRHQIYYKENGKNIDVIRILHEKMNPGLHL